MSEHATVEPGSARWVELVREAIARDGGRNWFLGDAALEIAPMGGNGANNGSEANLRQFADEIGVEFHSIRTYRDVAAAWPAPNRVGGTSWKVHQQLMSHQELIRPGMTVTQAAEARGHSNVGRTGPRASVEDRAAAVQDYMDDPDVAEQVMRDPQTRSRARAAISRHDAREDQKLRGGHGGGGGFEPLGNPLDLVWEFRQLHRSIDRIASEVAKRGTIVSDAQRDALVDEIGWLRNALSMIEDGIRGGSVDAALAEILKAGGGS